MSTHSVESYAPPSGRTDQLLGYPFVRPENSFLTDGETVTDLPDKYAEFVKSADLYLAEHKLPSLAERIPVISYGANSNPVRLVEKMGAYGKADTEVARQTVPNIIASTPDTLVVWHGKPGQTGSTFAELYKGAETSGQSSEVHVSFLTPLQLALLHATEGITYHLTWIDTLAGSDKQPLRAVAYVAGRSEILLQNGEPVRVKRTGEKVAEPAMTAEEAVDYMLAVAGDTVSVHTARELIGAMTGLSLAEKKARQAKLSACLGELGLNKHFSYPSDTYIARADFSSFTRNPHVLHLMEEVVAPLRPSHGAMDARTQELQEQGLTGDKALPKARQQLDIAEAVRRRAHNELAEQLEH